MNSASPLTTLLNLAALVELYEYKVSDLQSGREPRGGLRSVRELRQGLMGTDLPPFLLHRMVRAERLYQQWQAQTPRQISLASPGHWQPPATINQDEAQAWHELQHMLWHSDLMSELQATCQNLRLEPERPTLRVLYAVTENAERAAQNISVPFAVPTHDDPLVSLEDQEVVRQLTRTFGDMLLAAEGRQRVWQALEQIYDNPFPRHPDEDVLEARLGAVEQENLPEHERQSLSEALRAQFGEQVGFNRAPQERPLLRAAARRLQQWLMPRLARAPQLLPGAVPGSSILYAQEAASALPEPQNDSDLLCIHLGGPERLAHWQGLKLSWRSLGPNWQMLVQDEATLAAVAAGETTQASGQVALLRPELPTSERQVQVRVGDYALQLLFCGDYVLLRQQSATQRRTRLGQLASLGRGMVLLLDPAENYGALRLARALAQRLRGGPMHSTGGGHQRYNEMAFSDRQQSARRSLETLAQLLQRAPNGLIEQEARQAQVALHLPPDLAVRVHQAAHQAAFIPETLNEWPTERDDEVGLLNANGIFMCCPLKRDLLELRLPGDRLLSLSFDYRGELVALLPGYPAATVGDLQILPLHDLTLVLAREGNLLAACLLPPLLPGEGDLLLDEQPS